MGNNQAYTFMEETVIGAYNLGKLDKKLLKVLLEPYRGTDIDSGGSCGLKTKDGLGVEDVIIKLMDPKGFQKLKKMMEPLKKIPKNYEKQTEAQQLAMEEFGEACYETFHKITRKKFGWG